MQADVVIIGAGAAGLFCAIEAAKRGREVIVVEQSAKAGRKILMSGGGRCNFTNLDTIPEAFISHNPHFHKSALRQYTQWDFIEWVKSHDIPYHEKTLGQLFCDNKARDIVEALLADCEKYGVRLHYKQKVEAFDALDGAFKVVLSGRVLQAQSVVIATGGLSIPSMGSNPFAYEVAKKFGLSVIPPHAGLVPFTLDATRYASLIALSGLSVFVTMTTGKTSFSEALLFTHRGLSGPASLQLSSYWKADKVFIDYLPKCSMQEIIGKARRVSGSMTLLKLFAAYLPNRLCDALLPVRLKNKKIADLSSDDIAFIVDLIHNHAVMPSGTEGYRTAEVTLGGVNTDCLSSKTMACKEHVGLYFIGECVDVTGHLGGYNFQWAWSSGWVAGQYC